MSLLLLAFSLLGIALKGTLLFWRLKLRHSMAAYPAEERVGALDCSCGYHIEGADDGELFDQLQIHLEDRHPELRLTDRQIREIVSSGARGPGDALQRD